MDYYVGKILDGRYEIQEVLGVGGMAVVYRAYDNIDDRPVAVKILKEEFLANEEFRRRFKNESKAIAMLSHPNIVKVYDVSYGDRLQYIVMEYVEGITLKEYIEQRRVIPWKEAVHFLTQILRALQHAHDRGVVHRDIKPQNIMLLHSGNIKVTDFGIARFSRSETRTMSENAIGSVHYISPEQARGDFTDEKTDIYSVGVVLYEMLTGQLPFQSDSTVSVAIMQLQSEPRCPREINDAIPLGLEQITIRAMQKSPADRHQSAAEMLLDLEEFKRNPLIRFEYNYFVDREPTKYVSPLDRQRTAQTAASVVPARQRVPAALPDEDIEEERSRVVPMMIGIILGVIVLIGGIAAAAVLLSNSRQGTVIVDNFVGKYRVELEKNNAYAKDYEFVFETEMNDSAPAGSVIRQAPQKGAKEKRNDKGVVQITLVVANANQVVPDVTGKDLEEAKRTIRDAGFEPIVSLEIRQDIPENRVISTVPKANTKLETGKTVTLNVAAKNIPEMQQEVPEVRSLMLDVAKKAAAAMNFQITDADVTEVASTRPKGEVIEQTPKPGEKAYISSHILVQVSSGVTPTQKLDINVHVQDYGEAEATLRIYIDNVKQNEVVVRQDSDVYRFTVEGSGSAQKVLVTQDNSPIYEATIDFTRTPPFVHDVVEPTVVRPEPEPSHNMPSVLGMTFEAAVSALVNAGFSESSITRVEEEPNAIGGFLTQSGQVWSQDPLPLVTADRDASITLKVRP
ncbi:MAG: Stk1 family PASTA domain-containing Ser/Thr kinase [Oscillospiraceae bacterium]|jgi:serine/threonine-protein kinase|nr:Stk1 family PASTA domain-containing Ser/Thr kinase [Oscillospiraceae bacterium]